MDSVIAELPGANDTVVMLGGHLDSVLGGPGHQRQRLRRLNSPRPGGISRGRPCADVNRSLWLLGRRGIRRHRLWPVRRRADGGGEGFFRAYLNLDMVGSPNAGPTSIATLPVRRDRPSYRQRSKTRCQPGHPRSATDTGGASDHFSFEINGIPTTGCSPASRRCQHEEAEQFDGTAGVARRRVLPPVLRHACQRRYGHGPDPRFGGGYRPRGWPTKFAS